MSKHISLRRAQHAMFPFILQVCGRQDLTLCVLINNYHVYVNDGGAFSRVLCLVKSVCVSVSVDRSVCV